jgi:uncharacterized RDD family membrane protein YckC
VPVTPPEKLTIDTPEQIALEFPLAGAGSRFLAIALDTVLQVAGFLVLGLIALGALWLRSTGFASLATWTAAVLVFAAFLLYYGYYAAFESIWVGQTPGKRVLRIRVISVSGQPITPYAAILRNLLRIVDQLPGIYAVGVLSIFFTDRNQRLGDIVAGTVVVQEHELPRGGPIPALAPETVRLGANRLSVDEIEVIEAFLARRTDLPDYARLRTARELAARIRKRLEISSTAYGNDEALIEMAAAEFRRR